MNFDIINDNLKKLYDSGEIKTSTTKIFIVANEKNKEIFNNIIDKMFSGAVIEYEVKKFLELMIII